MVGVEFGGEVGSTEKSLSVRSLLGSAFVVALAVGTAGCSYMPSAGPSANEIVAQESSPDAITRYVVVDIDPRVIAILDRQPRPTLHGMFKDDSKRPDVRIGVGDALTITIWEAGPGGLFSTASADKNSPGSRTATLPDQEVAQNGTIQIPYAGRLKVAGLRPAEVESLIVKSLKGKAVEPQAVVSISKNRSTTVTVTGEVTNGMLAPISVKGERVLDVIASAGGLKAPAYETFVYLTRDGKTAKVPFSSILADSRENIYVRPQDVLTILREPRRFTAFGGTGRNELVPFDAAGMTLDEAIAKAGGLLDNRADATGVFLLRFEPAGLVAQLLPERADQIQTSVVPVIYRLNLRDANSYFMARSFPMHDKDILYVANAPLTDVQKVLNAVGSVIGPTVAGAAIYGVTK